MGLDTVPARKKNMKKRYVYFRMKKISWNGIQQFIFKDHRLKKEEEEQYGLLFESVCSSPGHLREYQEANQEFNMQAPPTKW